MHCSEWEVRISAHADGELPDEDALLMFGHLGTCPACRGFLRDILALRQAFLLDPLPQETPARSPVRATRRWTDRVPAAGRSLFRTRVSMPAGVVALALLVVGLLAGSWLLFGRGQGEREVIYVTTLPVVEVVSRTHTTQEELR